MALMAARIHTHFSPRVTWHTSGQTHTRGAAFRGSDLLAGTSLAAYLAPCHLADQVNQALQTLNGNFAAINLIDEYRAWIACDQVHSVVVFYGINAGQLYISDDAHWVLSRVGSAERDPLLTDEFRLTGYLLGIDTFEPRVKQVPPGEFVTFDLSGAEAKVKRHRWFRYKHAYVQGRSESQLTDELDKTVEAVIRRLTQVAAGRTIVLPLSGGYDSRLEAMILKRLSYPAVLTFTYGRPDNTEAQISKEVATRLGLPWEFVPYSEARWRRWSRLPEWHEYFHYASNLNVLPHVQDWPAVYELKLAGKLPSDSIFVPGMSADLLAGSQTYKAPELYNESELNQETLVNAAITIHYSLWDWSKRRDELKPQFTARILESLGDLKQYPDTASAFESQFIDGKCGRFLPNSVRAYEFFSYDWWLPYWDMVFLQYWAAVPIKYRQHKQLYNNYVTSLYQQMTGVSAAAARHSDKLTPLKRCAAVVRKLGQHVPAVRRAYHAAKRRLEYDSHPLAWYGLVPRSVFNQHYTGIEHLNSFLALQYLGELNLDDPAAC